MTRNLFCRNPFSWFEVTGWQQPKGDVYLCCAQWLPTSIGNLSKQSVAEIWNGEVAQRIRRSILDGTFSYCDKRQCPYLQTAEVLVTPVSEVTDPRMRRVIEEQFTHLPWGPQEINCAYDRSCNLTCPSCRKRRIIETDHADKIKTIQNKLDREAITHADYLSITGSGDPFGSPYFNRWLRTMNISADAKPKHIHLHTNAQLWTPQMWAKIPEAVRRRIRSSEISIDAAAEATYAVNRRGGSFRRLLTNLKFIASLRRDRQLRYLKISMVVQDNNFEEMADFVELGHRFGVDSIYFSQLANWGTFDDREYRKRAVHLPDHDRHADLLAMLDHPSLHRPDVTLGNLSYLRG